MKIKYTFFCLSITIILLVSCRKISYEMPPYPKQTETFVINKSLYNINIIEAHFHIHYQKEKDSTWVVIKRDPNMSIDAFSLIIEYAADVFNFNTTKIIYNNRVNFEPNQLEYHIPLVFEVGEQFATKNFKVYLTAVENYPSFALGGLYKSITSKFINEEDGLTSFIECYTIIEADGSTTIRMKNIDLYYNTQNDVIRKSNFESDSTFTGKLYQDDQLSYNLTITDTSNISFQRNRLTLRYTLDTSANQPYQFLETHLQKL